jgi:predicted PurR-regulated permease PerM/methylmalonyl-CoA mutase cobalamin-binding subunit
VVVFIATALYWARAIFIPVALAIYFAFILTPPVVYLQRRGLPRILAVMVVVLGALMAFAAVGAVVGRQVAMLSRTLPDHEDKIKAKAESLHKWISANERNRLAALFDDVYGIFSEDQNKDRPPAPPATRVVIESQPGWIERAKSVAGPTAEVLGQAAFTFVLLLFMLNRREDLRNRVIRLLGQGQVTTTTKAVDETSRRVSKFLLVQFLLNATFGTLITIGLLILGIPYAPLWGFVGFLMRYVPYVGSWIALIPPTLFAFAVSDGWLQPVLVAALFIGLELIAGNVAEPMLFGRSLGMSEVAQLVAAAFWAFLWGPVGLILSGPLTVCLLILGKYVPQWTFLSVLLGDEPVLSPQIAFYQRLAAHDHDEAADILEKELSNRPVEQVCDEVLIPVLATARRDAAQGRLSDDDLRFVATAVNELTEEVVDVKPTKSTDGEARVRVVVVPAKGAVDHAAAEVFARLLDPAGWETKVSPTSSLTSELLAHVEKTRPSVVVIAALAPGGMTHTRYLCKRLRSRFPELKIVVGRWAAGNDDSPGWANLQNAGANEISATLESTKAFLLGWRTVLKAPKPAPEEDGNTPSARLVGTVSA